MALWPLTGMFLGAVLWWGVSAKLDNDRVLAQKEVFKNASSLAKAYAKQLARTMHQIDQITLHVQYDWVQSHGSLNLQKQSRAGLYPASAQLYVTILNRDGVIVSTTLSDKYLGTRIDLDRDWFKAHKTGAATGLFISDVGIGMLTNKAVVRFTRRLEAADGSFDGVALVTAEQGYLATFSAEPSLGKYDSLLVAKSGGQLLAAKSGTGINAANGIFLSPPIFTSEDRSARMARERFVDGEPRVVAWHKLATYPLVLIVTLNEKDAFAGYQKEADKFRITALAASALLLLLTVTATFFSIRLTSRKLEAEEVKNAYRLATDGAREGFYMLQPIYDHNHTITDFLIKDCNERGAAYYGMLRKDLIGTRHSSLFSSGFLEDVMPAYRRAMETGFHESEVQVPASSTLDVEWIHRRLVRSGNALAVTLRDISESKSHQQALSRLANADAVTMLPNRHWLMNHLPVAVEQARNSNTTLAVLFVDLDDFKHINDTLGHAAGDELLQAVALRLKSVVRPEDHVARLGGDEFTIILERINGIEDVSCVAQRLIESFTVPFVLSDESGHHVSASMGISLFPKDADDAAALLKLADIAMYAAKSHGKDQYEFYQPHFSEGLAARRLKKQTLRQAIETDQFLLYYQPRVATSSGELSSLEALVRWMHPEHGMVAPNDFIPLAEDTGLIVQLGELIIKKACAQIAQWKAQQLPVVPVSINVSPLQFSHGTLSASVASSIAQYGLDPFLIQIEITESCMMSQNQTVTKELAALEALGIELFVDDFGTGYSSMSQLQSLRLDGLKVDRAFTAQLGAGKEGQVFFMAILSMAHVLGMTVVAEGVETEEQLRALQVLACDEVQGYLISMPLPADEIVPLMHKRLLFPSPSTSVHVA